MDRGRILVLGGLLVLFAPAGCLGGPPAGDTPVQPRYETYVFDHAGVGDAAIEGGIRYPDDGEYVRRNYVTLVTSPEGAERFDEAVLDAGARAFVRNTSFDGSYLIVVQAFPASSVPDYRVERIERAGDEVRVRINDSSRAGTADITVETVLVRVRGEPPDHAVVTTEDGHTFDSTAGVVTRTPDPTPTPDTVELPYASANDSENVDDPRDVRIENRGNDTNGYRLVVTYTEAPECRSYTPPCGEPERVITVLERVGKVRPGVTRTISDVAAKEGTYTITVEAEVPAGNGSRRTVAESFEWRVDATHGDAVVTITDDGVTVAQVAG